MTRDCLVCGAPHAHGHHTLPKGAWPALRDHPDVLIPLCFYCHERWHQGKRNVPWDMLPVATRVLIEAHASPWWVERWYPVRLGDDLPF